MNQQISYKTYGWIWIVLSPILWLMAAISTVESVRTYYVQLACFSVLAFLGFISGLSALFRIRWAPYVIKYLSWLGFIYFSGSGVVMVAYSIPAIFEGDLTALTFMLLISIAVIATGIPFYLMARNVGRTLNEHQLRV